MEPGHAAYHGQLLSWLTDVEARVALRATHFDVRQLCEQGKLRYIDTPLGRLIDPHSVNAYRKEKK